MGGLVKSIFGGGSAPTADPRIGQAALENAEIGREFMDFTKSQAAVSNQWAAEDRARYNQVFKPLQDQMVAEARSYDSPARRGIRRNQASADVRRAAASARAGETRSMQRMGIDPRSGRAAGVRATTDMNTVLAEAGAMNNSDRTVEAEAYARKANAVNLGSGLGVNPLASLTAGTGAVQSGSGMAMQGGRDLIGAYQNADNIKMKAYESNMAAVGDLAGAAGMYFGMQSSKELKTNKKPARNLLGQVRSLKVEEWDYKKGVADEGRHVGPYAEDFKKVTGRGDGKSISVVDAVGMTMGAIKELADKVDGLSVKAA